MKKDLVDVEWTDSAGERRVSKADRNGFKYYPDDMDGDMIPLCDAINALPGVRTFFCCSGHGRGEEGTFYVSGGCTNARSLKRLIRCLDMDESERRRWRWRREPYAVELEHRFWPLKDGELGFRISNGWVDHLKSKSRKREFSRIVSKLAWEGG